MCILLLILITISLDAQVLLPVKQNGKWGLINSKGNLKVLPTYDALDIYNEYGYVLAQKKDKLGLINNEGKQILPAIYDEINLLNQYFFEVLDYKKWKLINKSSNILLNNYEDLRLLSEDLIAFQENKQWGAISQEGKIIIPPKFDSITYEKDYIITHKSSKLGLYSKQGKYIFDNIVTQIKFINKDLILFQVNDKWGGIDQNDNLLFPPSFQYFTFNLPYYLELGNENTVAIYSLLNNSVVSISKIKGNKIEPFSEDLFLLRKDTYCGLINKEGKIIVPVLYDEILYFSTYLFRFKRANKWGIIDYVNNKVFNLELDYIAPLQEGISIIKNNNKYGLLDGTGKPLLAPDYDKIELDDNKIKAYREEVVEILFLQTDGTIIDANTNTEEHYTFSINRRKENIQTEDQKRQLKRHEWFYDATTQKWGLRSLNDGSNYILPQFDYIEVKQELGFTLVGIKKNNKYRFGQTQYNFEMVYGLVNNAIGRLVTPLDFLHIYFSDFEEKAPLARCVFSDGTFGLIDTIGRIVMKEVSFIGEFKDGKAAIGFGGKLSGTLKSVLRIEPLSSFLKKLTTSHYINSYTEDDQYFDGNAWLTCENCIWGYIDKLGKIVVTPVYDFVKEYEKGVGLVYKNEKWGAVNKEGNPFLDCEYTNIQYTGNKEMLIVHHKSIKYGLIDTLGRIVVPAKYDELENVNHIYIPINIDNKWGFADKNGNLIISPQYEVVNSFSQNFASVKYNGKWGLIDTKGSIIVPFKYNKMGNFEEGLIWVKSGSEYCYINEYEKVQFCINASFVNDFKFGVARVIEQGRWGLINRLGEYVVRPKFNEIKSFDDNGLAIVQYGDSNIKFGVINIKGELVTVTNYNYIYPFSEGFAAVKYKDKYGYINTKGQLIIPTIYSRASPFKEGRAAVQQDGFCGYIDYNGKVIVNLEYSKCLEFKDGKAVVYKGYQKGGVVEKNGAQIITPSLNRLLNFEEGRGLVRDAQHRFYYITEDTSLYNGYYEDATFFQNGVAIVKIKQQWGIINYKGLSIVPPKYDYIYPFVNAHAKVRTQGTYGLVGLDGKICLPNEYEQITYLGEGIYKVEKNEEIGYFSQSEKWIWEIKN